MKTNQDKLTLNVSLDMDDFNQAMTEYKKGSALLILEKGKAPELFIDGKAYPVVHLSYQYLTDGINRGVNMLVAEYMDGDKVKHIMVDNNTGEISSGNEYCLGHCGDDDIEAIDELVKRGFTKLQALEAYQCLCNLN